jgi:hypothetical protein
MASECDFLIFGGTYGLEGLCSQTAVLSLNLENLSLSTITMLQEKHYKQVSFEKKSLVISDRFYYNQYFPVKDTAAVIELIK